MPANALLLRALAAGLVALASSVVTIAAAPPSTAEHNANQPSHWGKDYRPIVSVACSGISNSLCNYTQDAQSYWPTQGFVQGFRPADAFYFGCSTPTPGAIKVCPQDKSVFPVDPQTGRRIAGLTFNYPTNDPQFHLDASIIWVCDNCGFSWSQTVALVRHEIGHAIGLAHTELYSVMRSDAPITTAHEDDRISLRNMYGRHDNTILEGDGEPNKFDARFSESLRSTDGRWDAVMQTDGNFVVYGREGAYFSTQTNGWGPGVVARMQSDCNFVLYSGSRVLFATHTSGKGAQCRMVMQNDGNLVIYDQPSRVVWARY